MLQKENEALRHFIDDVNSKETISPQGISKTSLEPIFSEPEESRTVQDANSQWLTLDEAYQIAVERGYQSSKDGFRKLVNRKTSEVRERYGIDYFPSRAGKGGNFKPYRDVES